MVIYGKEGLEKERKEKIITDGQSEVWGRYLVIIKKESKKKKSIINKTKLYIH